MISESETLIHLCLCLYFILFMSPIIGIRPCFTLSHPRHILKSRISLLSFVLLSVSTSLRSSNHTMVSQCQLVVFPFICVYVYPSIHLSSSLEMWVRSVVLVWFWIRNKVDQLNPLPQPLPPNFHYKTPSLPLQPPTSVGADGGKLIRCYDSSARVDTKDGQKHGRGLCGRETGADEMEWSMV